MAEPFQTLRREVLSYKTRWRAKVLEVVRRLLVLSADGGEHIGESGRAVEMTITEGVVMPWGGLSVRHVCIPQTSQEQKTIKTLLDKLNNKKRGRPSGTSGIRPDYMPLTTYVLVSPSPCNANEFSGVRDRHQKSWKFANSKAERLGRASRFRSAERRPGGLLVSADGGEPACGVLGERAGEMRAERRGEVRAASLER